MLNKSKIMTENLAVNYDFFKGIIQSSQSLGQLIMLNLDALYTTDDSDRIETPMDLAYLAQLEELSSLPDVSVCVRSARDARVVVRDEADREHSMLVSRNDKQLFAIVDTSLPFGAYQEEMYASLTSAVEAFRSAASSLQDYFRELQRIDALCWVVDPPDPTFKDDYRRIVLEERVWLHVPVCAETTASDLRVVGASAAAARWSDRLAERLALWDSGGSVGLLDNIMNVLDIDEFPQPPPPSASDDREPDGEYTCSICLCSELGTKRSLPQPLCANSKCGSYFHPACLFHWLVTSSGGVVPKLGTVWGKCPSCLSPISCSERDT